MSRPIISNPNHKGFDMGEWIVSLTSTAGTTKGLVYAVDITGISVTALAGGGHLVDIPDMVIPASAGDSIESVDTGIFAIALESVGAGEKCQFLFRGITEGTSASGITKGAALGPSTLGKLGDAVAAMKVIGYALEQATAGDQEIAVLFDGVNGFSGDPTT